MKAQILHECGFISLFFPEKGVVMWGFEGYLEVCLVLKGSLKATLGGTLGATLGATLEVHFGGCSGAHLEKSFVRRRQLGPR